MTISASPASRTGSSSSCWRKSEIRTGFCDERHASRGDNQVAVAAEEPGEVADVLGVGHQQGGEVRLSDGISQPTQAIGKGERSALEDANSKNAMAADPRDIGRDHTSFASDCQNRDRRTCKVAFTGRSPRLFAVSSQKGPTRPSHLMETLSVRRQQQMPVADCSRCVPDRNPVFRADFVSVFASLIVAAYVFTIVVYPAGRLSWNIVGGRRCTRRPSGQPARLPGEPAPANPQATGGTPLDGGAAAHARIRGSSRRGPRYWHSRAWLLRSLVGRGAWAVGPGPSLIPMLMPTYLALHRMGPASRPGTWIGDWVASGPGVLPSVGKAFASLGAIL